MFLYLFGETTFKNLILIMISNQILSFELRWHIDNLVYNENSQIYTLDDVPFSLFCCFECDS